MEETIVKEIQRLKKEMYKRKEEISDIKKLVNKEIDREFYSNLSELSEKELETYIEECLSSINRNIDPKPEKKSITSHRKILGKPIILIKRVLLKIIGFYIDLILDKQTQFNQQSVALYQALLLRLRQNKERIKQIEEKVSDCEENLDIILDKLKDLHLSLEQLKNKTANHNPTVED